MADTADTEKSRGSIKQMQKQPLRRSNISFKDGNWRINEKGALNYSMQQICLGVWSDTRHSR